MINNILNKEEQQYLENICNNISKDYVKGARAPYINATLRRQQEIIELPTQTDHKILLSGLNHLKKYLTITKRKYNIDVEKLEGLDKIIEKLNK